MPDMCKSKKRILHLPSKIKLSACHKGTAMVLVARARDGGALVLGATGLRRWRKFRSAASVADMA